MALNFEQELSKPLFEKSIDNHLLDGSPLGKGNLGQSVYDDPTLSIQFEKYQKTIDFLTEMKLSYSPQKITQYCNEISSYIFFFNVTIKENKKQWQYKSILLEKIPFIFFTF